MTDKPSWPQTADGVTDWEAVFEDPASGLLPLIAQARSTSAIKQASFVVVEQLYVRKDDAGEIDKIKSEISRLVPDDVPQEALPRIFEGVAGVLRQIKDERKMKAAQFAADKKLEQLHGKHKPLVKKERRKPTPKPPSRLPHLVLLAWGAALTATLFAVYYFVADPELTKETQDNLTLIQQMKDAVKGKPIKTHVFGGPIQTGTRVGKPFVTVFGITREACKSAAWAFVNRGIIAINGKVPRHVTPQAITDHCTRKGAKATLMWFPRQRKKIRGGGED